MSRVDSTRIAAIKAAAPGLSLAGSVVASDAFFPFRDGLDVVADNGAVGRHPAGRQRARRRGHRRGRRARHRDGLHRRSPFPPLTVGSSRCPSNVSGGLAVICRTRCAPALAVDCSADPSARICRSSTARAAGSPTPGRRARTSSSCRATPGTRRGPGRKSCATRKTRGHGAAATAGPSRRRTATRTPCSASPFSIRTRTSHGKWATAGRRSGVRATVQPGLGYTAMIVQRPDIANGIPFPAVLPIAHAALRAGARVDATYIPNFGGGINHGSVFYVFGRVILD